MFSRLSVPLLLAAAIVFAYGAQSHSSELTMTRAKPTRAHRPGGALVAATLDVRVGDGLALAFRVANESSKRLELTFPSGRTHEFLVLDARGKVVWRWSEGRIFTQSVQNKVLAPGGELQVVERADVALPSGTYTAVAILPSENYPVEQRVDFRVP